MITGFEEVTYDIREDEINIANHIAKCISERKRKEDAISSTELNQDIEYQFGKKLNPARLRIIINYIRHNRLASNVIANCKGYWSSQDPVEIGEYIKSLDQRISAIYTMKKSFIS